MMVGATLMGMYVWILDVVVYMCLSSTGWLSIGTPDRANI